VRSHIYAYVGLGTVLAVALSVLGDWRAMSGAAYRWAWGGVGRLALPQHGEQAMMIHCAVCGVTSPRDLAEFTQPSGRRCLACGARFANEVVSSVKAVIALGPHGPVKTALRRLRLAQVHVMPLRAPAAH
jgi:hypothetical protein